VNYACILADPPWRYADQGTRLSPAYEGTQRKAGAHYKTMSLEAIMGLGPWVTRQAADDSFLFLWTTNSFLVDGSATCVMQAWGFTPKQIIPWVKLSKAGRPHIGAGHYTRVCTEMLLLGRAGRPKVLSRSVPGVILAPRGRHSAKPVEAYELIERLCAGPRLELFARTQRPGWDTWGDQAPNAEAIA
jgi:N6-adenosine-specific RNA methylase IME4